MNLRRFCTSLAIALFATATAADAAVHQVLPGESIQAAIDAASPGDTIIVEPGIYQEPGNADFGLHITTDDLRLIGKVDKAAGDAGKVRVIQTGTQLTGVYAAPAACGPGVGVGECPDPNLEGFYIRGFTVEDFPHNGIQTRFVNDFQIVRNESVRNLHNGIYPTISAHGLVENNVSYGSEDTGMWMAASEDVRVIGNDVFGNVIGLEISVSHNITVMLNKIHHNTVGIGMFHPNAAGNAQLPQMDNWVVENNSIYSNNTANFAPDGSFQKDLPQGVGILLLGVSDHVIANNKVWDNDFVGIGVLGWCTATLLTPRNCFSPGNEPQADPAANDNLVIKNKAWDNGGMPPGGPFDDLAADISYAALGLPGEVMSGNCFVDNVYQSAVSTEPDGELPTDGC